MAGERFGRVSRKNDQIQLHGVESRRFERLATRVCSKVGSAFVVSTDMSLINAENVRHKLVDVLTENATQIIVRDDLFRNIDTRADNIRRVHSWLKNSVTIRLNFTACSIKNV